MAVVLADLPDLVEKARRVAQALGRTVAAGSRQPVAAA
jgi:hypothetical protein